ncbi:MAG: hypothetical protein EA405_14330 [Rhodospirillales bacterium]|nr:MAG: hypothetical protein EA405_14330 [Rhodospirillales bacterium]
MVPRPGPHRRPVTALARAAVPFIILTLTACEEGPRTVADRRVDDPWAFAQPIMAEGPLLVQVEGDPFDAGDPVVASHVVAAMTEAVTWTDTARFTADADRAANRDIRIVVTLNGASGLSGREQCLGRSSGGGPRPDGRIDVSASFCDGPTQLGTVHGQAHAERVDGRAFVALMRQITIDMLSPHRSAP